MATVLITCVGSGVGQSVIDSLNIKREHKIIGCDGNRNVYAHSFCDIFYVVPGLYTEGYIDYILNLCIENKVDIIVPGHDHELTLLSREKQRFLDKGIRVLVSESTIIEISRDKQKWYDFFAPLGCKIVPTISVREFLQNPDSSILPAIVKPSGGSASQGIYIINKIEELEGLNQADIIQPYLFPEKTDKNYDAIVTAVKSGAFVQRSEISIQLIFDKDSKYSGIFISKNTLKNGVPVFVDPLNPDEFEYTYEILKFVPILESHGVTGPVNIQGRVTPQGLFFFEMNMRFTGITGNRALLGFNEVDFLINNFLGAECTLNKYALNKLGVRQVACATIPRDISSQTKGCLTVVGGGSSVGQNYIKNVLDTFETINLLVRAGSLERYKQLFADKKIKFIAITDTSLEQVLCQTDVFVNFASALAYEADVLKYNAIRFVYDIVNKATKARIPVIINISSQSVYSQTDNVLKTEESALEGETAYAFQKIIMEDFFQGINSFSPISKVLSLRMPRIIVPSIYGQSGFFSKMILDFKKGTDVQIEFPENNTNLIHVSDVVSSIVFVTEIMKKNKHLPTCLNVSGENISMREYVDLVQQNITGTGRFILGDEKEVRSSSMIDGSKLEAMGWKKQYSISEIIKELQ